MRDPRGLHRRFVSASDMHKVTAKPPARCTTSCHLRPALPPRRRRASSSRPTPRASRLPGRGRDGTWRDGDRHGRRHHLDLRSSMTAALVIMSRRFAIPVGGGHVTSDIARGLSTSGCSPGGAAEDPLRQLPRRRTPTTGKWSSRSRRSARRTRASDGADSQILPGRESSQPRIEETMELVRSRPLRPAGSTRPSRPAACVDRRRQPASRRSRTGAPNARQAGSASARQTARFDRPGGSDLGTRLRHLRGLLAFAWYDRRRRPRTPRRRLAT